MKNKIVSNIVWTILVLIPFLVAVTFNFIWGPIIGSGHKWVPIIVTAVMMFISIRAFVKGYGDVDHGDEEEQQDKQ